MIGPSTGPKSGPMPHNAIDAPRLSIRKTSPIVAPPRVMGVEPAQPARKRNMTSIDRLLDTAQAIVNMRNRNMDTV